jgi:hypothetical protein
VPDLAVPSLTVAPGGVAARERAAPLGRLPKPPPLARPPWRDLVADPEETEAAAPRGVAFIVGEEREVEVVAAVEPVAVAAPAPTAAPPPPPPPPAPCTKPATSATISSHPIGKENAAAASARRLAGDRAAAARRARAAAAAAAGCPITRGAAVGGRAWVQ